VFNWLKKKKALTEHIYQFYATINPHTCEACLNRHGDLFTDIALAPPIHQGCRCGFLPVTPEGYQEKRERATHMQQIAQNELRRRALFAEAMEVLGADLRRGLARLEEAVFIDIHIEELAQLREKYEGLLAENSNLNDTLRSLFVRAYFAKMDHPKYQAVAAGLYGSLEYEGRKQIQALFADS